MVSGEEFMVDEEVVVGGGEEVEVDGVSRSGGSFTSGFSLSLDIGNGYSWALDFWV